MRGQAAARHTETGQGQHHHDQSLSLSLSPCPQAATAADDSDRMRKVFESRAVQDEERMSKLEEELKDARNKAEDADKQYDEVSSECEV